MSFNRSNTNGCPCKDCDDRVPEPRCHMTCQRFMEWREKMDRISEEERKLQGSVTMSDAKRRAIWKKSRYSSQQLNKHHRKLDD